MNPVWEIVLIVAGIYFAPTIIAVLSGKRNMLAIFALNLFGGWTGVGWMTALVWTLTRG